MQPFSLGGYLSALSPLFPRAGGNNFVPRQDMMLTRAPILRANLCGNCTRVAGERTGGERHKKNGRASDMQWQHSGLNVPEGEEVEGERSWPPRRGGGRFSIPDEVGLTRVLSPLHSARLNCQRARAKRNAPKPAMTSTSSHSGWAWTGRVACRAMEDRAEGFG